MKLAYIAFTDRGERLAHRIADELGGEVSRSGRPLTVRDWTRESFDTFDGLVFVGAAGIAVRAIAPHVASKTSDPAVVVIDECGGFAISLLSGHLGGANDLARRIADICSAVPVITTATDANGVFAVDEWAKRQNAVIIDPKRIQTVSSAVLRGETVPIFSRWNIDGAMPDGVSAAKDPANARVVLDIYRNETDALELVPRIVIIGVGCKKGTPRENIERSFDSLLERTGLHEQSIACVSSIDIKKDEVGLLDFCAAHGWELRTFGAEQLRGVRGEFTGSEFVCGITGVDNVCERSAVLCSGGTLISGKQAGNGVTIAAAVMPYEPDWRYRDE